MQARQCFLSIPNKCLPSMVKNLSLGTWSENSQLRESSLYLLTRIPSILGNVFIILSPGCVKSLASRCRPFQVVNIIFGICCHQN